MGYMIDPNGHKYGGKVLSEDRLDDYTPREGMKGTWHTICMSGK